MNKFLSYKMDVGRIFLNAIVAINTVYVDGILYMDDTIS